MVEVERVFGRYSDYMRSMIEIVGANTVPTSKSTILAVRYSGSGGYSLGTLGTLGVLAATNIFPDWRSFLLSFSQDHQLKSSQLELNPHSAGDSDG